MMKEIIIHGSTRDSRILIGESLNQLRYIVPRDVIVITDEGISKIYGRQLSAYRTIVISTGEGAKNLESVALVYEKLLAFEADRSVFIVAVGGGIVCDVAGFVASTYLRGVRFGFVSTTLLSQVDASVGGKNGVNLKGYKNIIGVFNQPEFVICDTSLLKTLPQRELLSGFGEIIKHALIADKNMFSFLKENYDKALSLDIDVIDRLVYDSVVVKSSIVNLDEKEEGERRKLNFGHTFGHAVERNYDLIHGEAVSVGMVLAARLSVNKNLLSEDEFEEICNLLHLYGLPVKFDFDKELIIDAVKKDKKREKGSIHFVLLDGIGKAIIEKITLKEVEETIHDLC